MHYPVLVKVTQNKLYSTLLNKASYCSVVDSITYISYYLMQVPFSINLIAGKISS